MTADVTHNLSLADMDKDRLLHPMTSIVEHLEKGPMIVTRGQGVHVTTDTGRNLIDCGAGLWCMNIGYGRDEIAETAAEAMRDLGYFHLFGHASNEPIIRLADRVLRLFHDRAGATHLSKVFFGLSGSDANDTNYKLVRYYNNLLGRPEKKKVISRIGGYHGLTYASAGLTGIAAYHKAFDVPLPGIVHTSCPHYYRFHEAGEDEAAFSARMLSDLEALIEQEGPETIAAFIAEPVMGVAGVCLPPTGYFEGVQDLLDRYDILFIADEVITGFGRTGDWFGTGKYNLKPDIVTLAKGITPAYFPLSASVISERIWEVMQRGSEEFGPVMHGFTYSGHPVAGAVGLKTIEILERENLIGNAADIGAHFLAELRRAIGDHPFVGDVRGTGLLAAVELIADKDSRKWFNLADGPHKIVAAKALDEGLIARALPMLTANSFSPPLTMNRDEADDAVARYARAIEAATPELEKIA